MSERLSEQIASIFCSVPASLNPGDNVNKVTTAHVDSNKGEASCDNDEKDQNFTNFRKKSFDFEEVDKRFKGKKASRKTITSESWESGSEKSVPERKSNKTDENKDSVEKELYSEDDSAVSNDFDIRKDDSFEHLQNNASNELAKGTSVRNQLYIWENFFVIRTQLEQFFEAAPYLQHNPEYRHFKIVSRIDVAKNFIANLLDKYLNLQILLFKVYPNTKRLLNKNNRKSNSSEDEEFEGNVPNKIVKLTEHELAVSKTYSLYKEYGIAGIQKWNKRTALTNNKFGNVEHSIIKQMKHMQVKHSNYDRLGHASTSNVQNNGKDNDPETFNVADFYHHLLQELIEYKSARLTDPVQLSRQWIQLPDLKSKMKRKVDTKITKRRKIRYTVHAKLANLQSMLTHGKRRQNLNRLFGKNQSIHKL